ncbi:MAG: hypothetical protein IT204_09705 [Fimbriimonadaceae bacterium]|nr:hypothetical protein [Fimbriimonadaceae bacterium]
MLAAHGSHRSAASSAPARRQAALLARDGRFSQVVAAFWKEFPALRDVPFLVDAPEVYVVPLFMAEGYFTARVVPRELGLEGPLTSRGGQRWHYTAPVGTAPELSAVIAARARETSGAVDPAQTALVLVGHGTVQNRQSKQAVLDHVARLQQAGEFAEVAAAYMEEAPLVADISSLVTAPRIVVVPLFVADGLHTAEDIPRDLGLQRRADGWEQPGLVGGKQLWYTSSVGTSDALTAVIRARVTAAGGPL